MDVSSWAQRKFVGVPEEFWRENTDRAAAYIKANPEKIYLLPEATLREISEARIFSEEVSIKFAREIKFSRPAKLVAASKEFEVDALSEALEYAAHDENFLPTGENFLITPENFSEADEIRRQCFILQVPLEICSEKEFSTIAAERRLLDHAADLLRELDGAKKLRGRKSELKLAENISLLEEFFSTAGELERRLKNSDTPIKLLVAGEVEERKILSDIFGRLNFVAENLSEVDSLAEKLPNCAACVFGLSALTDDFARLKKFLRTAANLPDREKISFALIRPALREPEPEISPSRILLKFSNFLSEEFFPKAPIFFLDAPEIFPLLQSDEPPAVDEILGALKLKGRDEYLTRLSLEKFFAGLRTPSKEALLQRTGVPFAESQLRRTTRENFSAAENLFSKFGRTVSFADNDALKILRLRQAKKISADELQTETLHEKILLIAARGKLIRGDAAIKSILFDAGGAVKNFIRAAEKIVREIFGELIRSEEFCSEKLASLQSGRISAELRDLLDDSEKILRGEYAERAKKLRGSIEKIIGKHRADAKEFLDFVCSTMKNFSEADFPSATLPTGKNFDVPNFDAGLAENFSADKLASLVTRCTEVICTAEDSLEHFHLSGTFRRELRELLEATAQEKFAALEKVLRRNVFVAVAEYFAQVSEICRARQEVCSKAFCRRVEKICDALTFLNQDFSVLEATSSALKNLYEIWRKVYPKQAESPAEEKFPADLLERRDLLLRLKNSLPEDDADDFSAEKFLPREENFPQATTDADFTAGKAAYRKGKYDVALKNFELAAAAGQVEAMKYLAYMNQRGLGTQKNLHAAINNYLDAFRLGDSASGGELGEIFSKLSCRSRALEFYQVAADMGDDYSNEQLKNF